MGNTHLGKGGGLRSETKEIPKCPLEQNCWKR